MEMSHHGRGHKKRRLFFLNVRLRSCGMRQPSDLCWNLCDGRLIRTRAADYRHLVSVTLDLYFRYWKLSKKSDNIFD